jgi:hypothetical protein
MTHCGTHGRPSASVAQHDTSRGAMTLEAEANIANLVPITSSPLFGHAMAMNEGESMRTFG